MEIQIRPFQPADWNAVRKIYIQAIEEGGSTFQTEAPDFESWDKNHLAECRFVAECDSEVIGWCALSPVNNREPYRGVAEVSIYIDRSHRKNENRRNSSRISLQRERKSGNLEPLLRYH